MQSHYPHDATERYGPPFIARQNDERNRALSITTMTSRTIGRPIILALRIALFVRRYFLCPQLDSAAADVISPFCSSEINSASRKLLAVWATHETYLLWLRDEADRRSYRPSPSSD